MYKYNIMYLYCILLKRKVRLAVKGKKVIRYKMLRNHHTMPLYNIIVPIDCLDYYVLYYNIIY